MNGVKRLWEVGRTVGRYGLLELLPDSAESRRLRKFAGPVLGKTDSKLADRPGPERLRLALEELGPLFVKFGQALSTRPDILPPGMLEELARLQDNVPPFPLSEVHKLLTAAYGKPASEVFSWFDEQPLASASIAQVHAAKLHPSDDFPEGREVVVKILRPNVEAIVERDLAMLKTLASLAEQFIADARLVKPTQIVAEYEQICRAELDLLAEAANAALLRRNSQAAGTLYVPEVEWDYCHDNVFVMERIWGVPVSQVEKMQAADVNLELLAKRGVETFFSQVFTDNFFHADMHPGNVLVDMSIPEDPSWIALDFGIMGRLNTAEQLLVAQLLVAFSNANFGLIARLLGQSGWVPANKSLAGLEGSLRVACEPMVNAPLAEISFGDVLVTLLKAARRYEIQPSPTLVLLEKTIVNVEGLGRRLYPQLDLWATAKPFLERWVKQKIGPQGLVERVKDDWPILLGQLPQFSSSLAGIATGSRISDEVVASQKQQHRSLQLTVVATGLLATGALTGVLSSHWLLATAMLLGGGWLLWRQLDN